MRQSILAVLAGMAAFGDAVAIAQPGDSVSSVPNTLPGAVLSAHMTRDDSPFTDEDALSASAAQDDGSSVSARADIKPFSSFVISHTRATNEVTEDKCKRDTTTDERHKDGCGDQPDDKVINKAINKFNDKLGDKPLERLADCLGTNKDMVQEYCDCMNNCDVLRAYYRSIVLTGKEDIKAGKADNHKLEDEACRIFLDGHEDPIVSGMLGMINGMNICAPRS